MAKELTFGCKSCGDTFLRWSGRCPSCGDMNAISELTASERSLLEPRTGAAPKRGLVVEDLRGTGGPRPERLPTGIPEFDRVLGGGLPPGAAVLLGGEPGIGKSTLLAQACAGLATSGPVLYLTAEESLDQIRNRCDRLGIAAKNLHLSADNDADAIADAVASGAWRAVVVDSIQLISQGGDGQVGSSTQIRACTALLVDAAKRGRCGLLLIGHVTKDGQLAGPRLLEHLVDTVLSFEGDRYQDLRTLRAVKNRHGTTNELGLFTMTGTGLAEVPNPSAYFIGDRDARVPGSCVVPALEGNRCVLVEIQALVNPTDSPNPQRRVSGCDANRTALVTAVLSRRLGLPLGPCDIFVNVTGGARILEPAADLGIALALASAWHDRAIPADLASLGEIGLGGELRAAPRYDIRAAEARRLGFKRLLGPGAGSGRGREKVTHLRDALEAVGL